MLRAGLKMTREFMYLTCGLLLALAAAPAHAQEAAKGAIDTRLEARKVVRSAGGTETLVAADNVKPGDVIEYAATYRNTTREPVKNLVATLPIPAHTEWVVGSARPANAKASPDARAFGEIPLKRRALKDGRAIEETIPYRDYRYLRWYPGELAGDASVTFVARVRVVE
jgi:uncharacterized repeat protein (TIGR01451 family)